MLLFGGTCFIKLQLESVENPGFFLGINELFIILVSFWPASYQTNSWRFGREYYRSNFQIIIFGLPSGCELGRWVGGWWNGEYEYISLTVQGCGLSFICGIIFFSRHLLWTRYVIHVLKHVLTGSHHFLKLSHLKSFSSLISFYHFDLKLFWSLNKLRNMLYILNVNRREGDIH